MKSSEKSRIGVAAVLILAALTATAAWSQGPQKRFAGGPRHQAARLVEFLELTDTQKADWKAVHQAQSGVMKELQTRMAENRKSLHEALESDNPNPTEIGELTLAGRDLRSEAEGNRQELRASLEAILTSEQIERWEAYDAANGDRRSRGRRGPRGPRGALGPG